MALIIPNIGYSVALDPNTGAILAAFTKMDSISIDVDGTLTPVYGGPGFYPVVHIGADRKPMVSLKGSETTLQAASVIGATVTTASTGSKTQIERVVELTIAADGTAALPNGDAISATAISTSIVSVNGKAYTTVASAPTTGEYVTPAAGDTKFTFATADAGVKVVAYYSIDTESGGKVDYSTTSQGKVVKFVANAFIIDTEAPGQPLVPVTFKVNACQFVGKWTLSQERQKASASQLDLNILDPGGTTSAVEIQTAAKFAG